MHKAKPYTGGHFEEIGSEESQTVESYERRVHGTEFSEPQRQREQHQYTERRVYGRDENGEIVVKIERDPKDPVRPASPVRPISPVGGGNLLKPIQPVQPLTIPRVELHSSPSPRRQHYDQLSPISPASSRSGHRSSPRSAPVSPRSNISTSPGSVPLKKVTKKSRWVSIYDGRPVSPYTQTIGYEPAFPSPSRYYSSASSRASSISPLQDNNTSDPYECAYLVQNPLYRD